METLHSKKKRKVKELSRDDFDTWMKQVMKPSKKPLDVWVIARSLKEARQKIRKMFGI